MPPNNIIQVFLKMSRSIWEQEDVDDKEEYTTKKITIVLFGEGASCLARSWGAGYFRKSSVKRFKLYKHTLNLSAKVPLLKS